jgi:diguanylate cyclase (GGDEF)-like protein
VKKRLTVEDFTMIFQWVAVLALAPFVLLPLFPRQEISAGIRAGIVVGTLLGTAFMSVVYLVARRRSHRAGAAVVNITALFDVVLVFTALMIWPLRIPGLYWIFPILVIVVAARFGYKETAAVALVLSALYAVTIFVQLDGTVPVRTIVGDTLLRIVFMLLVAVVTVYLAQRVKGERRDAHILSRVATAIGAILDADELMNTVVEGVSEASGLGRCSAYMVSEDGDWAVPTSTTEKDPDIRRRFFNRKIDLRMENVAREAIQSGDTVVITEARGHPMLDNRWMEDFGISALLVLPVVLRDGPRGVIFVERRGRKRFFTDKEVQTCKTIVAQASAGLENALRYAEEQKKRSQADIMYQASRELASSLETDEVLENACRLAVKATGGSGCTAFVLEEPAMALMPVVSVGAGGARRVDFPAGAQIPAREMEDMYGLAQRPPALKMSRPSESKVLPPFLSSGAVVLIAPYFSHGRMAGLLCVTDDEGRDFSDFERTGLAVVANETAMAVMNATLHQKIRLDAAQMASLVQLANAIGSTADLEVIMRLALDTVRHLFDCSAGLIYRLDDKDGCLWYVDSFGYPEEVVRRIATGPYARGDNCRAVTEERLIAVDDLSAETACESLARFGYGSTICVGMRAEGRTLGVLHIRSGEAAAFGEEDQQLAQAIADQVALALQRAVLFEEIRRLAITDPLTGVFNVRRLESALQDEVSRAKRYSRGMSFLMVDVDNLKSYNDTLGHQRGDVVLSQVASIIDGATRDVDKVFRYGGDEFCVILPETDAHDGLVVAEKIRRAVSDFHFPGEDELPGGSITISVGIATIPDDAGDESEIVYKADLALYAAKQGGRNSVSASG